jgi:hypothetical protein
MCWFLKCVHWWPATIANRRGRKTLREAAPVSPFFWIGSAHTISSCGSQQKLTVASSSVPPSCLPPATSVPPSCLPPAIMMFRKSILLLGIAVVVKARVRLVLLLVGCGTGCGGGGNSDGSDTAGSRFIT